MRDATDDVPLPTIHTPRPFFDARDTPENGSYVAQPTHALCVGAVADSRRHLSDTHDTECSASVTPSDALGKTLPRSSTFTSSGSHSVVFRLPAFLFVLGVIWTPQTHRFVDVGDVDG